MPEWVKWSSSQKPPGQVRARTVIRTHQSQPFYQLSQIPIFVRLPKIVHVYVECGQINHAIVSKAAMSSDCTLLHRHASCGLWVICKERKLIPKTIVNRKRDCAWGCARRINTTWENLQIEMHKSGGRSFRSPDWFVFFDLQIFCGGVYPLRATSHTISFSISNSFWY